jgi:deoxyribose-phosphate aldolase
MKTLELSKYIDHTLLKPDATSEQIKSLCEEAAKYGFFSVCLNPQYIKFAKSMLVNTEVKICTVVGFPLGASTTETKVFETQNAIAHGADEIDMVLNIGAVKSKNWSLVENDIEQVVKMAHQHGKLIKVIFETCLLNDEEKIKCCQICSSVKADFVKTSTGFSNGGATLEDVKLMKSNISQGVSVKASGGVRDLETAKAFIAAGAARLGTSSGVNIVQGSSSNSSY